MDWVRDGRRAACHVGWAGLSGRARDKERPLALAGASCLGCARPRVASGVRAAALRVGAHGLRLSGVHLRESTSSEVTGLNRTGSRAEARDLGDGSKEVEQRAQGGFVEQHQTCHYEFEEPAIISQKQIVHE